MNKCVFAIFLALVVLLIAVPTQAQVGIQCSVEDSLFVTYSFESLDQVVYEQALVQFNAETIPRAIEQNLKGKDQTLVRWGLPPDPLIFDSGSRSVRASFILGGSDVISDTLNATTMRRTYTVKTDWRKLQVNLTSDFSVDFAERLATRLADWQKINHTDTDGNVHPAYHFENRQEGLVDVSFDLVLPTSALGVRVEAEVLVYDMPPLLQDQLLNSPFLILGALAVVLVVILIYRKIR